MSSQLTNSTVTSKAVEAQSNNSHAKSSVGEVNKQASQSSQPSQPSLMQKYILPGIRAILGAGAPEPERDDMQDKEVVLAPEDKSTKTANIEVNMQPTSSIVGSNPEEASSKVIDAQADVKGDSKPDDVAKQAENQIIDHKAFTSLAMTFLKNNAKPLLESSQTASLGDVYDPSFKVTSELYDDLKSHGLNIKGGIDELFKAVGNKLSAPQSYFSTPSILIIIVLTMISATLSGYLAYRTYIPEGAQQQSAENQLSQVK